MPLPAIAAVLPIADSIINAGFKLKSMDNEQELRRMQHELNVTDQDIRALQTLSKEDKQVFLKAIKDEKELYKLRKEMELKGIQTSERRKGRVLESIGNAFTKVPLIGRLFETEGHKARKDAAKSEGARIQDHINRLYKQERIIQNAMLKLKPMDKIKAEKDLREIQKQREIYRERLATLGGQEVPISPINKKLKTVAIILIVLLLIMVIGVCLNSKYAFDRNTIFLMILVSGIVYLYFKLER